MTKEKEIQKLKRKIQELEATAIKMHSEIGILIEHPDTYHAEQLRLLYRAKKTINRKALGLYDAMREDQAVVEITVPKVGDNPNLSKERMEKWIDEIFKERDRLDKGRFNIHLF